MKWFSLIVSAALALAASTAMAAEPGVDVFTPAAGLDSGLGELAPYSEWKEPWVFALPAEKIDSGLGELPLFSEWREPWVFAMPAESIDSGLGEIAPGALADMAARLAERAPN